MTLQERFWAKVDKSGDCWVWTSNIQNNGYGMFWVNRRYVLAHRQSYELAVGPIPEGLSLDHLCRNTRCVNPAHLEPVTHQENMRRWSLTISHCPAGHPYSDANTYMNAGKRRCRRCAYERNKRNRLAKQRISEDV